MKKPNQVQLTKSGWEELKHELDELTKIKLPTAIQRVARARDFGDLSENSEYHAAREDLAMLEGRVEELEELLKRAVVIKTSQTKNRSTVGLGCKVTVAGNGATHEFDIVGEWEANPLQKKISVESPLGKALLGRKVGETVEFEAPIGKILYKINKIN